MWKTKPKITPNNSTINKREIRKIDISTFKNIDFCIYENNWIMINKKTSPEIHFVIHNPKLKTAIEAFILKKD